jgi:PAS domain S-box-containing protein
MRVRAGAYVHLLPSAWAFGLRISRRNTSQARRVNGGMAAGEVAVSSGGGGMDEQFLIKLADQVPAVLAFWDKHATCRYANKAYRNWYNVAPEQLLGKHISEVLGPLYALSKPHIDNALKGEMQRFQREIPDPAGGPSRVHQVLLVPHLENGEVAGFFALATEVANPLAQYQAALDAAPGAMLGVDERGTIIIKNATAARMFGYAPVELLGLKIGALVPEMGPVYALFISDPAFEVRSATQPEILWGRRKDASEFPIELSLHRQQLESGAFTLWSISDRSAEVENVRMAREKDELTRINRDVEAFASIASHDLKAPLRAIQNAVYWLEQDLPRELLSNNVQGTLRILRTRAHRLDLLVNGLLDYARAGETLVPVKKMSVRGAVVDAVLLLGGRAQDVTRFKGHDAFVMASPPPFQQVIHNLIGNALKHAGNSTDLEVVVSVQSRELEVVIEVRDNGPGIPPEYHERIFQPFEKLRPRDEVEGAGIGLALVRRVLERVGGSIALESEVGKGARFIVTWPKPITLG